MLDRRYLTVDRDPLFTEQFRDIVKTANVKSLRLPPKSPNLNAFAERFVLSIESECLNRMIFFSETHLRYAVRGHVAHYHQEQNDQGVGNKLLKAKPVANSDG